MAESTFIPFARSHERVQSRRLTDSPPLLSKFADKFIVEGRSGVYSSYCGNGFRVLLNLHSLYITLPHRSDILEQTIPGKAMGGGTQFTSGQKFEAWREKFLS